MKQLLTLFLNLLLIAGCGEGAKPIEDDKVPKEIKNPFADKTPPRFLSYDSINDHNETNLFVLQVEAFDKDGFTDNKKSVTYSLVGGKDAPLFEIDRNLGYLTFKEAPDFENPLDKDRDNKYQFKIKITDEANNENFQDFTLQVQDINETEIDTKAPVFIGKNTYEIDQNTSFGFVVTANDNSVVLYDIIGGTDQNLFTIKNSTGIVLFETPKDDIFKKSYDVNISATDRSGNFSTQLFTIIKKENNTTIENNDNKDVTL